MGKGKIHKIYFILTKLLGIDEFSVMLLSFGNFNKRSTRLDGLGRIK